jgi:protein-S-isoprenylcysteine O-methyltransferase Ste14
MTSPRFDEQLIAAQRVDDTLKRRYEQEITNMLEQKLNTPAKISFIASVVVSVVMAVALTIAAASTPSLKPLHRLGIALGAVYAAAWVVISIRVLRRGAIHMWRDASLMGALPWVFTVLLVMIIMIATGGKTDSVRSVWMMLYGLIFLLMGAVFLLQYMINAARAKVEERLLETQLRIAELAEMMKNK